MKQAGGDAAAGMHGGERVLASGMQPELSFAVGDGGVLNRVVALEPEVDALLEVPPACGE